MQHFHLDELVALLRRGISPAYAQSGLLVVNQKCVRDFRCDWTLGRRHDEGRRAVQSNLRVQRGDVLVNSTGVGTLGRVARVPRAPPESATVDSHVTVVRPDPLKIDPDYLGWVLVAQQPDIERMGEGATGQTELSAKRLGREVVVPVPARAVQRRIAIILDAYDNLIEVNRRRIALLEEMARRLFEEWFVHFRFPGHEGVRMAETPEGPLPEGWSMRPLADITTVLARGIAPKYDDTSATLVVGQKCIRDQRLSLTPARRQSRPPPTDKIVQSGDVLINSTGVGTLGRTAQAEEVPPGLTVDTHVTIVRPREDVDRDFFGLAVLRLEPMFERLGVGATGQTELNRSRIAAVEIAVPPADQQTAFGEHARPLRSLAFKLALQNERLAASRDLLLPRLISGDLPVAAAERELETAA